MLSGTFGEADVNVLGYRSDVYSLGCILFKMCFGVTPYQHIEKMQVGRRDGYCFFCFRILEDIFLGIYCRIVPCAGF